MKYAFILGTNCFVTPHGFISYTENGLSKTFLSIRSIYHDTADGSRLAVDLETRDTSGKDLKLTDNKTDHAAGFNISEQRDRILVTKKNGDAIIDILQLDDKSAMRLDHNIIAELEVQEVVAVIRLRGAFMLGGIHIEIDNEKIFVNNNSYANSVLAGNNNLQFSTKGVIV